MTVSRFIIHPNNYWKIVWNNFSLIIFILYIILVFLIVSFSPEIDKGFLSLLDVFDSIFMLDRVFDLFVGFFNPNGQLEHRLYNVIVQNLSSKFFLEILYIGGPYAVFYYVYEGYRSAMVYCVFKIFRYFRLFEIDGQIEEILEYLAAYKTVFEIKKIERNMQIM